MSALPRIVTVDPTGTIARQVRAVMDLLERPIIIYDVPSGPEALEEIKTGRCSVLITAWDLQDDAMRGLELALRAKQAAQNIAVLILGDDPDTLDEETLAESPFVYLSRPFDIPQFLRVLSTAIEGGDLHEALKAPAGAAAAAIDMGPVPNLDVNAAQTIIDKLLTDLGAMAIILSSRAGEVLLERGAVGYLDRQRLTSAMLPVVMSNIEVKDIVGGQANALQFYDGENYDVFVLSIGLHHFMCLAFDGEGGSRQFGAVNRFGRRAAEDIIALLGANAWMVQRVVMPEEKRPVKSKPQTETKELEVPLERAEIFADSAAAKQQEPVIQQLEPIADLDLSIFDQLGAIDEAAADDLFDMDKLEEVANKTRKSGALDWDDAVGLGLLK